MRGGFGVVFRKEFRFGFWGSFSWWRFGVFISVIYFSRLTWMLIRSEKFSSGNRRFFTKNSSFAESFVYLITW